MLLWKRTKSGTKETKMAASPGAEEDSVYDTGRLSLFDLILERTRAQNKVKQLTLSGFRYYSFIGKIKKKSVKISSRK